MESKSGRLYVQFMEKYPTVKEWLEHRPVNTQSQYGLALKRFCEFSSITPEQFQNLPRKEARDISWNYIKTLLDHSSVASVTMAALKSFYRNKDGEILPFDSHRGGKHSFNNLRRKKASYEHTPTKKEIYEISYMTNNFRDRAIILVLYQSGIRVNALCSLNYGHVRKQLERNEIPLRLRITDEIDSKLRGYRIPFYDTFIGKEAIEALRKYCEFRHRYSDDETPLFLTKRNNRFIPNHVWSNFRKCVRRAGFDVRTIWLHSLRKAFRRELRTANIKQDYAEILMGHVLHGSQENYFNRNDVVEELRSEYEKVDFSREGTSEHKDMRVKMEQLEEKLKVATDVIDSMWNEIDKLKK